jgi:hypothetical protein
VEAKNAVNAAEVGADFLPCLNSNISIEIPSTQHRKSASALGWNVLALAQKYGLENLGFLTLTFKDHVLCVKEAQRRLNSLLSNIIKPRYLDYIGVLERQKSRRIHYHLLVVIGTDIRTGFDFSAVEAKDYSSANAFLRAEWAFWRKTAPAYGFGRTELMPIKSSEEAIGKYIGKYIGKHIESRQEADKGARLVRYSRGARVASTRFQYVSEGSRNWRSKLRAFAYYVSARTGCEPTMAGIREVCGPRWAYVHRDFILSMPSDGTLVDTSFWLGESSESKSDDDLPLSPVLDLPPKLAAVAVDFSARDRLIVQWASARRNAFELHEFRHSDDNARGIGIRPPDTPLTTTT